MTFVGESVSPWYVAPVSTFPEAYQLAARGDGLSGTAAAGADAVLPFVSWDQLEAGSDAVFTLVLTGVSGSAQVRVSYGFDPDWSDSPSAATLSAGTVTVSTGDTAVSLPGWTPTDYLAMVEEPVVRLEVLSGSVVLDQVRLRIWPPGGPIGGYSATITPTGPLGPYPLQDIRYQRAEVTQYTADPSTLLPAGSVRIERPGDNDREGATYEAQAWARGDWNAATTATVTTSSLSGAFNADIVRAGGGVSGGRTGTLGGSPVGSRVLTTGPEGERAYMPRTTYQGDPEGTYGEDWFRHPDRTPSDDNAYQVWMGDPSWSWAQRTATIVAISLENISPNEFHLAGTYYLGVTGLDEAPTDAELTAWDPMTAAVPVLTVPDTLTTIGVGYSAEVDLPDVDGPTIQFELTHDVLFTDLPIVSGYEVVEGRKSIGWGLATLYGGTFETFDVSTGARTGFDPLSYYLHPAPYRVWVAAEPSTPPLRQRNRDKTRARLRPSRQRSIRARGYL